MIAPYFSRFTARWCSNSSAASGKIAERPSTIGPHTKSMNETWFCAVVLGVDNSRSQNAATLMPSCRS